MTNTDRRPEWPIQHEEQSAGLPGTSLTRLPRAAVLAAADARLHAGLLGDYLDVLASAADSGRRLSRAELDRFRALGQAAAESGASLPALVDLYLSATWRVWPSLPTVRQADRAARDLGRALPAALDRRPPPGSDSGSAATWGSGSGSGPDSGAGSGAGPDADTDAGGSASGRHTAGVDGPPPAGTHLREAIGGITVGAVSRTRAAASAVLRASDDAVAAVCEGYERARTARARSEEAMRRELVDDLLTGTSELGPLLERAVAFGLRLEAPHVVLVASGSRRFLDGRAVVRAVEESLREHCATEPLVATKDGLLVCVVPQETNLTLPLAPGNQGAGPGAVTDGGRAREDPSQDAAPEPGLDLTQDPASPPDPGTTPDPGTAPARTRADGESGHPGTERGAPDRPAPRAPAPRGRRRMDPPGPGDVGFAPLPAFAPTGAMPTTAVRAITRRLGAEPELVWRLGVSRARSGVAGVRIGYEEARNAVELAGRMRMDGQVVHADDLLIYKVLLRDREPLEELVETVLSPLRSARGGAGPLIETLDAYFATGGVALAAARRLHLSVRALTYRLDRIHALTRHDPTSPTDRYVLQTAVLGARLLGWERGPR
ncbi:PucR family transcriptional regulator [Parafrankia colletiae]|uniref:PucR family transcriptional regulator n=1 Tax=Parafrankia colletiae TaxID=573497 RepID=A0A1S1RM23_9ACTN|nr:helix-turn-helix domain-containing protein [Parafrankia colletiae]MCK9899793.1 helix-turn-helix domain-containing protein [Frankia sp. Cpl3]OHV46332.1 PucR family transcriptional regulator [Parafrankia colletiae]